MFNVVREAIGFTIANYAVTFFRAGVVSALLSILWIGRASGRSLVIEKLLGWHVFWSIGVSYLVNFVFHAFFGGLAARFIGWQDSPFQFEVATASLSFAARGLRRRLAQLRPAAGGGAGTCAVYPRRGGRPRLPELTARNFAPGNAGPIFNADIIVPLFGFALLWGARGQAADRLARLVKNLPHAPALSHPTHHGDELR